MAHFLNGMLQCATKLDHWNFWGVQNHGVCKISSAIHFPKNQKIQKSPQSNNRKKENNKKKTKRKLTEMRM